MKFETKILGLYLDAFLDPIGSKFKTTYYIYNNPKIFFIIYTDTKNNYLLY